MTANLEDLQQLDARLREIAAHIDHAEPDFAVAIDAYVRRLAATDAGAFAPVVGDVFPAFALPDTSGRITSSADFLGAGPVVVSFLRGHWCPFCLAQADAFQAAEEMMVEAGATVVLITPERAVYASRLAPSSPHRRVLCDLDHGLAATLGLMAPVDEPLAALLAAEGSNLPHFQGVSDWVVPIPATFILDPRGVIVDRFVNPDYRVRMQFNAIMAALQAAQA